MTHDHGSAVKHAGICPDCGKVRFLTRKDARTIGRRRGFTKINAYRCGEFFHLGHLPRTVRAGLASRDQIRPSR